jgi:hypothetical protein
MLLLVVNNYVRIPKRVRNYIEYGSLFADCIMRNVLLCSEIMNDVIRTTVKEHNKQPDKMVWRVLVVDDQSMRMVSACTKMQELSAEGITSKAICVALRRTLITSFARDSRGVDRQAARALARHGGHLLDHAQREERQDAHAGLQRPTQESIQRRTCVLHRR